MSEQKHTPEPFGYFKAEPFGWTDCAETDEGAVPLYDHESITSIAKQRDELILYKNLAEEYGLCVFQDMALLVKQRDELLAAAERQFMADHVLINMPHDCTKHCHETALDEHTNAHYELRKAIASVKGNEA